MIFKIKMKFKDLNTRDIKSRLIKVFKTNKTWKMPYLDIDIPIDMSEDELNDFNNRNITPDNINKIIELCDYLNIKEISNKFF